MQQELIRSAVVHNESGKSTQDNVRDLLLDSRRLLVCENLYQNAAHGGMHRHLIGHLSMVFEGHVVNTRADTDADESPVRQVDNCEHSGVLPSISTDAMYGVDNFVVVLVNTVPSTSARSHCAHCITDWSRY